MGPTFQWYPKGEGEDKGEAKRLESQAISEYTEILIFFLTKSRRNITLLTQKS